MSRSSYYTDMISTHPELFRNMIRFNAGRSALPPAVPAADSVMHSSATESATDACSTDSSPYADGRPSPVEHAQDGQGWPENTPFSSSGIRFAGPALPERLARNRLFHRARHGRHASFSEPEGGFCDFASEPSRLLLVAEKDRRRLFLLFSASIHGEELSRVIDGAYVRTIRKLLGDDIYESALKRGRYAAGSLAPTLCALCPPGPLDRRMEWLAGKTPTLLDPKSEERGALNERQRAALWLTLRNILLREIAPQWAPCFN